MYICEVKLNNIFLLVLVCGLMSFFSKDVKISSTLDSKYKVSQNSNTPLDHSELLNIVNDDNDDDDELLHNLKSNFTYVYLSFLNLKAEETNLNTPLKHSVLSLFTNVPMYIAVNNMRI